MRPHKTSSCTNNKRSFYDYTTIAAIRVMYKIISYYGTILINAYCDAFVHVASVKCCFLSRSEASARQSKLLR